MASGFPAVAVAVAGGLEEEDKRCPEERPQEEEQKLQNRKITGRDLAYSRCTHKKDVWSSIELFMFGKY